MPSIPSGDHSSRPRSARGSRRRRALLGYDLADLPRVPHYADGRKALQQLHVYQYGRRDSDALRRDRGRRRPQIVYRAEPNLPAPVVIRVASLCKRPQRR